MKKLKIDEMKVKSFITSLEKKTEKTCKGGAAILRTLESPNCFEERKTRYPVCQYA